jgi:hypothetical protein
MKRTRSCYFGQRGEASADPAAMFVIVSVMTGAVTLCATCGIVAPTHGTSCSVCKRPFEVPRRSVPAQGDTYWVALRCTFACRACAFPSPLEGIELDVGVNCAQCGAFQRFDKSGWDEALAFAHEVGDLAGPWPEGRFPHPRLWIGDDNPHRGVGVTQTFAERDLGAIHVQAAPGYPTCSRCPVLLELRREHNALWARCPSCREEGRYEAPAEALGFSSALRAVIAHEQRTDLQSVRVQQTQAGLVALLCPHCGAGVRPGDGETIECEYCKTFAFLPARMRTRGGGQIVQAPIFWILLQGPSDCRVDLLRLEAPKLDARAVKAKAVGLFKRGLSPLPGIPLAPPRPGLDLRQLLLTLGLSALALALGVGLLLVERLLE